MDVKLDLADLQSKAQQHPYGGAAHLLAVGKIEGSFLVLDEVAQQKIDEEISNPRSNKRLKISDFNNNDCKWPKDVVEEILACGKIEGDWVIVDLATNRQIRQKLYQVKPVQLRVAQLKSSASQMPEEYVDYVFTHGKIEGDFVILEGSAAGEFRQKFSNVKLPSPPEPTWTDLATNFTGAMAGWAMAGFKVVENRVFEERHAHCQACEYWDPDARLGMGKCKKCGCTRMKLWLATSRCPLKPPKWE